MLQEEEVLQLYLEMTPRRREIEFATTADVAKRLGMAQRTIQYWLEVGAIAGVRIGQKYQVYFPSVESFLARNNRRLV